MHYRTIFAFAVTLVIVAAAAFGIGQRTSPAPAEAVQSSAAVWNSGMVWAPSLQETGDALAGLVNQIDAACTVDVDPTVATNGAAADGTVYAFAVTWACPPGAAQGSGGTWQSAMLWRATLPETGDALAELVNQIDAACTVDVDRAVATNGTAADGPVYAFAVTWACPEATQAVAVAPSDPAATVTLEAGNFAFSPTQLTIPANSATPITVTNVSDLSHTFTIEALGITVEIPPGETRSVTVTAPPGTHTYACMYHPSRMIGTLVSE